jgi:hypothetical protein
MIGMVAYFENFVEEFADHFFSLQKKIEDLSEPGTISKKPPSMMISLLLLNFHEFIHFNRIILKFHFLIK